jgi:hypothetical protein
MGRTHVEQIEDIRSRMDRFEFLISGLVDVVSKMEPAQSSSSVSFTMPTEDSAVSAREVVPEWPFSSPTIHQHLGARGVSGSSTPRHVIQDDTVDHGLHVSDTIER